MARITKEDMNNLLKNNCVEGHLVQMLPNEEYKGSKTKNWYKCECGWEFDTNRDRIKQDIDNYGKYRCPTLRVKKSWNYKMLIKTFKENNCQLLTPKSNLKLNRGGVKIAQKVEYICECGEKDVKNINDFLQGARCMSCGSRKAGDKLKHDYTFVKDYMAGEGYKLLTPEEEYLNGHQPLDSICDRGHKCQIRFIHFYNSGRKCKYCANEDNRGEGNPKWNPDLNYEDRIKMRRHPDYHEWRDKVFQRDSYTCQVTGIKGGKLVAHHLYSFDEHENLRLEVDNGIVLLKEIHKIFHKEYGYGQNTGKQFKEFKQRYHNGEFDNLIDDELKAG